jgi:hypothetical protein
LLFAAPAQAGLVSSGCSLAAEHKPSSSICFSLLPHGFEQAYEESMDQNIRKQKEIINWLNKNSDLIYRDGHVTF